MFPKLNAFCGLALSFETTLEREVCLSSFPDSSCLLILIEAEQEEEEVKDGEDRREKRGTKREAILVVRN